MLCAPGRRLCSFGPGPACQTSATAMAWDTSRSWQHMWQEALLQVNSEERRKEDLLMVEVISTCPRHKIHLWNCLCCRACWDHAEAAPTSTMPENDLVHIRRMLVAAIRVLQLHNLPVDSRIVSTMLHKSLEEGVQFIPAFLSQELFDANLIDNPLFAPPPRQTSKSSLRSSCSSLSSTSSASSRQGWKA